MSTVAERARARVRALRGIGPEVPDEVVDRMTVTAVMRARVAVEDLNAAYADLGRRAAAAASRAATVRRDDP